MVTHSALRNESVAPVASTHQAHVVQLYPNDGSLLDVLGRFVGGAIAAGDASVVIATPAHLHGLEHRLKARGLDIDTATRAERYIALDAVQTLPRILVKGRIDEVRFYQIAGDLLTRARNAVGPRANAKHSSIAVFGELVALLWADGKPEEAIRLEQLWNELAQKHVFALLCAYPMASFDDGRPVEPFLKMCAQHSAIVPNEVVPNESDLQPNIMEERLRTIAELQQKTQALENALHLRQSEERFRLLIEAVQDYAIFMLDPTGHIVSWNAGAQRIKGYRAAEIIGRHFSIFYGPEDVQNGKPQWELEVATSEGRLEDEGWRLRQDGTRFWASVVITAIRDESGHLIGFGKVTRDFTERMRGQQMLQQEMHDRREAQRRLYESEQSLRQLSRNLLRTQDEERRRIGRELHDTLGQSLAAIKINLDCLIPTIATDTNATRKIEECLHLAEDAIKEVRTISYLLYPPMLEEMGLQLAIGWYLDGFSTRSGVVIEFDADPDFDRLSRDAELALFRILQESLTNLHRHSGSRTAHIRLFTNEDMAILQVRDSGKGLANVPSGQLNADSIGTSGVGLRGMNERMLQLGGRLDVVSTPNGTTISALLPLKRYAVSQAVPSQLESAPAVTDN